MTKPLDLAPIKERLAVRQQCRGTDTSTAVQDVVDLLAEVERVRTICEGFYEDMGGEAEWLEWN